MPYPYLKALHIIFVVTWFAGLFYIVRLFVYQSEAMEMEEPDKSILIRQYKLMQKRLWYGITWPSMILTVIFGTWMLIETPAFLKMGWMHLKLAFVVGLLAYHFICHKMFLNYAKDTARYSSSKMRLWNEVATLFLVAIVFLVILRSSIDMVWGVVGFVGLSVLLFMAIKIYKRIRTKS